MGVSPTVEKEKSSLPSPSQLAAHPIEGQPMQYGGNVTGALEEESDTSSGGTKKERDERAAMEGLEPAFYAKVHILNDAIKEIGMGRYQYELFFTAGTSPFAAIWLIYWTYTIQIPQLPEL